MTGWGADGRTRPTWRSCAHLYMDGDRCDSCKARRVESEPLPRRAGGLPMGHYIAHNRELLVGLEHLRGSISAKKWNHDNGNGPAEPSYGREAE